jgi:SSS family solute:Na+ symporter
MAKIVSLLVKFGALVFVIALPTQYAIELQLLGGILIIQTLPSVVIGLYTRWLHPHALLAGWLAGIASGIGMWASLGFTKTIYNLVLFGVNIPCYAALSTLVLNLAITLTLSGLLNAVAPRRHDATIPADYFAT